MLEKRPGPKPWPILRRIPREETRSGTLVTPQGVGVSVADMELGEVSLGGLCHSNNADSTSFRYQPIGEGGFRFSTGGRGHSAATVWYTILGSGSLSSAQPLMQASELSVNSAGHRFDRPGIGVNFRLLAAFGLSVGIIGRLQCLSRSSAAFGDQGEHRLVVQ